MADISMCSNENCPCKYNCYRYIAIPNEHRQSYGMFEVTNCEHFWEAEPADRILYLKRAYYKLDKEEFRKLLDDFISKP